MCFTRHELDTGSVHSGTRSRPDRTACTSGECARRSVPRGPRAP